MSIILVTWAAEIWTIVVQGQSRKLVLETPISNLTRAKMDWRCVSSGKPPASQMQSNLLSPYCSTLNLYHVHIGHQLARGFNMVHWDFKTPFFSCQAQCLVPLILATWEERLGGPWLKTSLGKKLVRPHLSMKICLSSQIFGRHR
jgi:hypothetical protein